MPTIQQQLKTVSKNLVSLSKKVDQLTQQAAKLDAAKKTKVAKKAVKKKAVRKKAVKKKTPVPKKPVKSKKAVRPATVLDNVLGHVRKSRNGIAIAKLQAKTKLESRQLSNALYKLAQKGLIKTKSRGVYIKC